MRTFANANPQQGFTLFELLVVLALLSMLAGLSATGIRRASPTFHLKVAEDQIVTDIRRVQTEARHSGSSLRIDWHQTSYRSASWPQDRTLPRGVNVTPSVPSFVVYPDGYADPLTLTITVKDRSRTISVNAYSGKVIRHDDL